MAEDVWITESKTTQLIDIWQQLKQLYPPETIPYAQKLPTKELLELLLSSPDDLRIIEIPDIIGDVFDDQTSIRLFKNTLLMLFSYDVMCNNPKYIARRQTKRKYLADTQHSDFCTEIAEFKNLKLPVLIRETSSFFCKFI